MHDTTLVGFFIILFSVFDHKKNIMGKVLGILIFEVEGIPNEEITMNPLL